MRRYVTLLAVLVLVCGCAVSNGVRSNLTTVYGMQVKTPTVGNIPGLEIQLGIIRNETLEMAGSNTYRSATHVGNSGLFRSVVVDRTVEASCSDVTVKPEPTKP